MKLSTAQIGKCGELLVQYRLLLLGIESAPMSTDTGIDLVAYSPLRKHPITIQVKTNLKSKPSGGTGKAAIDWWVPDSSPADYLAFVDLAVQKVWLMTLPELKKQAQQNPEGRFHLYMYTDPSAKPKKTERLSYAYEFEAFLLENCSSKLFSI